VSAISAESGAASGAAAAPPAVLRAVRDTFGFDTLRPLQADSIAATLAGRDALTVMPTGGGKSLCYQIPPLVTGRLTLVVSPLIALMRDQIAAMRMAGIPAAAFHSHLSAAEARDLRAQAERGGLRLLLVAPERLLLSDFLRWVKGLDVGALAIDEAHCISQWGHDFRPEYRRLAELREAIPGVPIGAFTATATPRVRQDIVEHLRLRNPAVFVGVFDRPNLTYRILPRLDLAGQVAEALGRHAGRAAIIYCISRKDTESLAASMRARGVNAAHYHAGLDGATRTKISEDFRSERLDVVIATVAFGMGIDRGDVRCVIHAAMPKSIEHYQQETGRAGRDGLPAECLLLYSGADATRWRMLMERAGESDDDAIDAQLALLESMQRFANTSRCRHRAISEYFGQQYPKANCSACDICLRELQPAPEAHDTARKILSCIARCNQMFGAGHVADVLLGRNTARIRERGHDRLSTYGLLASLEREQILSYIDQLIDAGDLERTGGEYPILRLTAGSAEVLRSERQAALMEPKQITGRSARERGATGETPLAAEEQALFEALRRARRQIAEQRDVPPFVILGDAALEELCRVRPGSPATLVTIRGIGQRKIEDFGEALLEAVRRESRALGLELDARTGSRAAAAEAAADAGPYADPGVKPLSAGAALAAPMFRRGDSVEQVAASMGRARSTVEGYLADFARVERPESIRAWVDERTERRILDALEHVGDTGGRLRPIYEHLGGEVPYLAIRVTLAFHRP
jgi:ATP-dependent DNA helicase RecQ